MALTNANRSAGKGLIICFGEMFIDFIPTGKSVDEPSGFLAAPGGSPANVAIAVARLGGHAAFIGKLSGDEFGRMLARTLKREGVGHDGITFDRDAQTALFYIPSRHGGETEMVLYGSPRADMRLKPEELNLELIRSAKVFHFGSMSLTEEPCRSAHLKAIEVAKEAGCLLSYDPNFCLPLWPSPDEARDQILNIWKKADMIKVNETELKFLTQSEEIDDNSASSLWHSNLKLLLLTLGERGCKYYAKNFRGSVDAFPVNPVDTVGAGDAFIGALLTRVVDDQSILEDEPKLREVLKFANACGAITTTKEGAIPALPTEDDALNLIKGA